MHISPTTGWRHWFAAALFPFKIYTVLMGVILVLWHAHLPVYSPRSGFEIAMGIRNDFMTKVAYSDFGYLAGYAIDGYFVCAGVLIIGGLVQMVTSSRRAASITIALGLAAIVIGRILLPYCWSGRNLFS